MRFAVASRRFSVLLTAALVASSADAADARYETARPEPSGFTTSDEDVQDIVYLAPKTPVFIRLRIRVDGAALQTFRDDYSRALFAKLDADQNGQLDEEEAAGVPPAHILSSDASMRPIQQSRLDQQDGKSTVDRFAPDELIEYVRAVAGTPFAIAPDVRRPNIQTKLFDMLDHNDDNKLTHEEARDARAVLQAYDVDDDGIYIQAELQPDSNPAGVRNIVSPGEVGSAVEQLIPLLVVVDRQNPSPAVDKLVRAYDKLSRDKVSGAFVMNGRLSRDEVDVGSARLSLHDTDGNQVLDREELAGLLGDPSPDLELRVDLQQSGQAPPRIEIVPVSHPAHHTRLDARVEGDETAILNLDTYELALNARIEKVPTQNFEQDYKKRFGGADRDNNGYLDFNEFRLLGMPETSFRLVDADRDGKIFRDELTEYVAIRVELAEKETTLVVSKEDLSLFEVVDSNHDAQLSARELSNAAERIAQLDQNGDGAFSRDEFISRLQMSFKTGIPRLLGNRTSRVVFAYSSRGRSSRAVLRGPRWFQNMDQNRDGDLSRREFLGTKSLFDRLDSDRDGLLDPKEAAAAIQ